MREQDSNREADTGNAAVCWLGEMLAKEEILNDAAIETQYHYPQC